MKTRRFGAFSCISPHFLAYVTFDSKALYFGVPMAVVPIFGDQPQNADVVAKAGCGVSFRRPLETFTVPALREVPKCRARVQTAVSEPFS